MTGISHFYEKDTLLLFPRLKSCNCHAIQMLALTEKSNTTSNNIGNEKWKCNIILEMLDYLYGLCDCGIDEARQWLTYAVTIWIFM